MDMAEAQSWAVVIASVGTAVGMVINHWRVGRFQAQAKTIEDKAEVIEGKSKAIEEKLDVVHELTNSRLSRIDGQLTAALAEIAFLRAVGAKAEQTRVVLADSTAAAAAALPS